MAARREQLVAAAIRVAARDGVDAATTRAIAEEAGVSLGIVHYCFTSKDELLREVVRAIVERTRETAIDALQAGGDLRSSLLAAADALLLRIQADEHLLTYELTTYALRQPDGRQLAQLMYDFYFSTAVEFFEQAAKAAGIVWTVPAPTLARLLTALTEGVTLAWLVDRDDGAARATYQAFADYVVGLARPASARAVGRALPDAPSPRS